MSTEHSAAPASAKLGFIVLAIYLVIDTLVQLAFKWAGESVGADGGALDWLAAAGALPQVWLAAVLYVALFVVWMLVLRSLDLSHAFPLTAAAYITVPLAAAVLFNEDISLVRALGIGLIVVGMAIIGGRE